MKRILLVLLLLLATALPAAASLIAIDFTFLGFAFTGGTNSAEINGTIHFDSLLLSNPGLNVFDLTTPAGVAAVPYLTLTVSNSADGNGTFNLGDFSSVIFDTSILGLNIAEGSQLVGQATSSPTSNTWGTPDIIIPESSPPRSYAGDFQLVFAATSPTAPTGISPFQLGTNGGNTDGVQLTSMYVTPEPTTYLLLCLSLGAVGLARKKLSKPV